MNFESLDTIARIKKIKAKVIKAINTNYTTNLSTVSVYEHNESVKAD